VLAFVGIVFPVTFAIVYTSQLLWVWHSVNDFTRQGASYASTHCWESSAGNVVDFMRANAPLMIDRDQFQNGQVAINVSYAANDPGSGQLVPFSCDSDCSTACIPDTVTVGVSGYEFRTFITAIGLPAVPIPSFQTSLPMEGAGCDPEQGVCQP
jgi:hypothetical protein